MSVEPSRKSSEEKGIVGPKGTNRELNNNKNPSTKKSANLESWQDGWEKKVTSCGRGE